MDVEIVPDALPEGLKLSDRPAPERVVVVKLKAMPSLKPFGVKPNLWHVRRLACEARGRAGLPIVKRLLAGLTGRWVHE